MTIVEAIAPNLSKDKVRTSSNNERWFKIAGGVLNIPPEGVLRGNFILMDKCIEALHNFEQGDPLAGLWDDSKVNGQTFSGAESCINALRELPGKATRKRLACDIETRNTGYDGNKVLLIGFAYDDYEASVIRCFEPEVIEELQKLFNRSDITFAWQNGKFDTARLKYLLNIDARVDEDTMLLHYAGINERKGTHGLKDLGELYLQTPKWDDELDNYKKKWCLQHRVKLKEFQYDMIPSDILIPYLYRDCCATFQLIDVFKRLMRPGSLPVYEKLIKASNVFKDIEVAGCLIDKDYMYELQDKLDTLIYEAEKHVKEESARTWDPIKYAQDTGARFSPLLNTFNLKSPKQLKWMLEAVTGKKLTSTNRETIDQLIEEYPDIPFLTAIGDLRKYNKYMDTYVIGLIDVMNADGRVHCTFNLHGTETGRLSCSEPNMQNIPRMKLIKNLFVAPEGYKLVQFDYSQAELRVLAWLSQDEYLRDSYRDGKDLHDAMALKIFGEGFTKEQRVQAKTVNFGVPYGRGPGSMKSKLHMTMQQATKLVQDWYKAAPGAKRFVDRMRKVPYEREPYTTLFGRQRHYIITMDNRNHVENEAVNFPVSSIASDLTMLSVCSIHDQLLAEGIDARIVNTVHDSIIIECVDNPEALKRVKEIGVQTMADMPKKYLLDPPLDFPFKADAEIGQSWGDLEDADQAIEQEVGDN